MVDCTKEKQTTQGNIIFSFSIQTNTASITVSKKFSEDVSEETIVLLNTVNSLRFLLCLNFSEILTVLRRKMAKNAVSAWNRGS